MEYIIAFGLGDAVPALITGSLGQFAKDMRRTLGRPIIELNIKRLGCLRPLFHACIFVE